MKTIFYSSLIVLLLSPVIMGDVYHVPGDYSTIQAALNACSPGDTVVVSAGMYTENIVWPGTENLYLVSESGDISTIINGDTPSHPDSGSVIYFLNVNNAVVNGFTIKNGSGTQDTTWGRSGGGIFCKESSPEIINNIIENNNASYGAGISCLSNASPLIESNTIKNNNAVENGGGIDSYLNSDPQIINNLIENNYAGFGGGISCANFNSPLIKENTVTSNVANISGGGIIIYSNSNGLIYKNTITLNQAPGVFGAGIRCGVDAQPIIRSCNVTDNFGVGITCRNSSPLIDSCLILNNLYEGVICYDGAMPEVHYCNIYDNGMIDFNNLDSTVIVNAEHNWWGNTSGPVVGVDVSLYVDFDPYLPEPIPVELTSFTATTQTGKVFLHWTTATETNNLGFEIERKIISEAKVEDWNMIGITPGYGTTTEPKEYSFVDNISELNATALAYRLKQVDFNGSFEYSDVVYVDYLNPIEFTLNQNYPNPFNPVTTIRYSLPIKSQVDLVVYNSIGESVTNLVSEVKEAGNYEIEFDASAIPSGVYFYKLQAELFVQTKKMIVLK
jgi:hypothetical protein